MFKVSELTEKLTAANTMLKPLLDQDLVLWKGLPKTLVETLTAVLGQAIKTEQAALGWYLADRYTFKVEEPARDLVAYARNGEVVLIQPFVPPPLSAMEPLGQPSAILPHEILSPDAYVHEYLYCQRGLVLSIAEPFQKGKPWDIVRVRGIRPLDNPNEFGPEFYRVFEDKMVWRQL